MIELNNREKFYRGDSFAYAEIPSAQKDGMGVQILSVLDEAVQTYLRWVIDEGESTSEYAVIFNYIFDQYLEVKLYFEKMVFSDQEAAAA